LIQKRGGNLPTRVFWVFCSLKLAILVILSLAFSLAAGTIVESLYDTPTAQYWIYRAWWFRFILGMLGVNIFCVAISRYPWRKKHIPFLLAHLGILILLFGSWITDRIGIDGSLRITEGETAKIVELDSASLVISDQKNVYSIPVRWQPPTVEFTPISAVSYRVPYDIQVDQYLTHADPTVAFTANSPWEHFPSANKKHNSLAAAKIRISGGPMGISQDLWLWEGATDYKKVQAGPAVFSIGELKEKVEHQSGRPSLQLLAQKDGSLIYKAVSSEGKIVSGKLFKNSIVGQVLHPGWKGSMAITLVEWLPDAIPLTTYHPARVQYGSQAPASAIHIKAADSADVWLGLGDRAIFHIGNREIELGYFPKRIVLPFSLRLDRFTVEHDQGTLNPAAYASRVIVYDGNSGQKDVTISMNEPLQLHGFTLYQASYENAQPRPVTSILAVNQDPGRMWKYFGSLLIVLGSVLLFAAKYHLARSVKKNEVQSPLGLAPVSERL
jgi:hypothetical protein